jgi:hypothetical protein
VHPEKDGAAPKGKTLYVRAGGALRVAKDAPGGEAAIFARSGKVKKGQIGRGERYQERCDR